jgi:hypothetical protein
LAAGKSEIRTSSAEARATNFKISSRSPRRKSEIRNPKSEIPTAMCDGKSEIRNPKSEISAMWSLK